MTARARLADALKQHQFWHADHSSVGSAAHCLCGLRPRDQSEWADHVVADVLLSLPGIAIVDRKPIEGLIASFRRVEVLQLYDAATHRWVDLVAELLAAANAAEQVAD